MTTVSVDDRDSSIIYNPVNDWSVHTDQNASFQLYDNTDTFSNNTDATIAFTFEGTTIQYWGNQGPAHGDCDINLDGKDEGTVTSFAAETGPPIALYNASGLSTSSKHTIIITVASNTYPNFCELDRFVYTPLPGSPGSTGSPGSQGNTGDKGNGSPNSNSNSDGDTGGNSSSSSGTNWTAVGAGIGAAIVFIIIAFGLYRIVQQRNRRARLEAEALIGQPAFPNVIGNQTRRPPASSGAAMAQRQSEALYSSLPPPASPFVNRPPSPATSRTQSGFLPSPVHSTQPLVSRNSAYSSSSATPPSTAPYQQQAFAQAPVAAEESWNPFNAPFGQAQPSAGQATLAPGSGPSRPTSASSSQHPPATSASSSSGSAQPQQSIAQVDGKTVLSAAPPQPVIQHTDAGRVQLPEEDETPVPDEVPPAYEPAWQSQA